MNDSIIALEGLTKHYEVGERAGGLLAAAGSVFRRRMRTVRAVEAVTFAIDPGEVVGFLGPNGAGKTTTLKMLSGLLHPTAGTARVLGYVPWRRDRDYLRRMTLVIGNRNQLYWDLPAMDTLLVNQAIYRIPEDQFRATVRELTDLLDLAPLLTKQVRQLSLGERMKCEIAAALVHRPAVLFLDEPTLGLDVTMQTRIRQFIRDYNERTGATVLLTSHYMADVEALCRRVVVIHEGRLLYDGELRGLAERLAPFKILGIALEAGAAAPDWARYGERAPAPNGDDGRVHLRVPKQEAARITGRLLSENAVADLTVEDPPIEAVIDQIFQRGLTDHSSERE